MGAGRFCFGTALITGGHETRPARQCPFIRPKAIPAFTLLRKINTHQALIPPAACVLPRCGKDSLT